jgi:hemoglobin
MRKTALLLFALTACAHGGKAAPAASRSLYDRLGGLPAISAVIDAFLGNVAADERINYRFAASDLGDLRQKLIDQVCQATGGPCTYKGRDMLAAHRGMGIQPAEFDALVGDLQAALAQLSVPTKEQGELLGALGGFKPQIVNDGVAAGN